MSTFGKVRLKECELDDPACFMQREHPSEKSGVKMQQLVYRYTSGGVMVEGMWEDIRIFTASTPDYLPEAERKVSGL